MTQIYLDQKTPKAFSKIFQSPKEIFDENLYSQDNEWDVFNVQGKEIKFLKNNVREIDENQANNAEIFTENESISEGQIIPETCYFDQKQYSINHFMIWEYYYKKKVFERQGIHIHFEKNAVAMTNYIKLYVYLKDNPEGPNFTLKNYDLVSCEGKKRNY